MKEDVKNYKNLNELLTFILFSNVKMFVLKTVITIFNRGAYFQMFQNISIKQLLASHIQFSKSLPKKSIYGRGLHSTSSSVTFVVCIRVTFFIIEKAFPHQTVQIVWQKEAIKFVVNRLKQQTQDLRSVYIFN